MDEQKPTEEKIAKDGKKVTEPTYPVSEIIRGFEERLLALGADLEAVRDLARRVTKEKEQAEASLRNRPFRELSELSDKTLLAEVERRMKKREYDD